MAVNEKYVSNLSRMIKQETVSFYGQDDLSKFFEFHKLLKELFPSLFAVCEIEKYEASLLLKWKGKRSDKPVLFMNHHDTVEPQDEAAWTHPPFSGEVFEGKLWGRGTLDNKGGLWGMLQAADDLAAEGFVPGQDIYFESSCNEETTFQGALHLSEKLQERGIRFDYVLDEGGMITYEPIGGAKDTFAMIGMGERGCSNLLFTAKGNGGHASSPDYDTPLVRLGRFMAEADRTGLFKKEISPVILEMFRRLAPSTSGPIKLIYSHPKLFAPVLKLVMPKTSGTAKALLQTTIAFTMAKGSEGRNVIPSEASVVGDMRVSHHQGYEKSLKAIASLAAKYDIELEVLEEAMVSPLADYKSDAYKLMEEAVTHAFPNVKCAPYIMTGCSDARFMARLTDNCFHFVPFIIDKQQLESIHGIDESVDVSTLEGAVEFYKYLMKELK